MKLKKISPYWTAAAAMLLVGILAASTVWRQRQEILDDAGTQLTILSRDALARTEAILQQVEMILTDINEMLPPQNAPQMVKTAFKERIIRRIAQRSDIVHLSVIDAGGIVVYSDRAESVGRQSGEKALLQRLIDTPNESTLIVMPPITHDDSTISVTAILPMRNEQGQLLAAAMAVLPSSAFQTAAQNTLPGYKHASILITNYDRWILARAPDSPAQQGGAVYTGKRMGANAMLESLLRSEDKFQLITGLSGIDGIEKIAGQASSPQYRIATSAAAPVSSVMSYWVSETARIAVMWLIFSGAALATAFWAQRRNMQMARLEQQAKDDQAFIVSAFDSLPGIFYAIDAGNNFRRWNRRFEMITGYSAQEMTELSPLDLFSGDDCGLIGARLAQAFNTGYAVAQARLRTAEGKLIPYAFTGALLETGGEKWVVGFGLDISNVTALQRDLERSNTDLSRFAYIASHQLQEPLRTIAGYVQLLDRRYADRLDHEGREFISYAVNGAKRLSELIADLLEFSHISTAAPALAHTDLNLIVRNVADVLKLSLDESGAVLEIAPLPSIIGEERFLTVLFQNVVANSIRYRSVDRPLHISIGAKRLNGVWQFHIADTGIGIQKEYRSQVFDVFQRLHSGGASGTGIGLALARKVVERHRGRIWVEDNPDGPDGIAVCFTLDAAQQS